MLSERVERIFAAKYIMRCLRAGPELQTNLIDWSDQIERAMQTDPGDRGMSALQVEVLVSVKRHILVVADKPENFFERQALLGIRLLLMP